MAGSFIHCACMYSDFYDFHFAHINTSVGMSNFQRDKNIVVPNLSTSTIHQLW